MKRSSGIVVISLLVVSFLTNCIDASDKPADSASYELKLPIGFPPPQIPEDNQLTSERVELGKKLFFDPILSLDSSVSCGSCHFQHVAFSDTVAISQGVHGKTGMRNAQPLINLAYSTSFFRDGGVKTLEMQVIAPIETEEEMHLNILRAVDRLKAHPEYPALIRAAYDREPDPFSITRAIAAFERTLISGNAKYDQYIHGNNGVVFSENEKAGMNLFFSEKLKCSKCHNGFNFSNQSLENNGLYSNYEKDFGKKRITLREEDEGKFKVPTLRNIELTAPYMHDGSLLTLEEVIDHYASGGSEHPTKNENITGFDISEIEKEQLSAFLKTLTDESFITKKEFKP